MDPATRVHQSFVERVTARSFPAGLPPKVGLSLNDALSVYRSTCLSRALDRESRFMQARGEGFYTIGSSGHEGMAAVALALRPTDMAFLHYRDAAFQIARSAQIKYTDAAWDMLLSFACAKTDPISGGRHKVLGSKRLNIPPQTSTIASHLPKALGAAYSINAARSFRPEHATLEDDGLILCSFGDASANHSTAQGAFNTASWTSTQSLPLPLLFCCEDNGIGISTKTPKGWIEASFKDRPGLAYFKCNGLDIFETFETARRAASYVRERRKPAFLHFTCVRLYGHAGADLATSYLPRSEVAADEANDPLLNSVRLLDEAGFLSSVNALNIYLQTCEDVAKLAKKIPREPRLAISQDVQKSIVPPSRKNTPPKGSNVKKKAPGERKRAQDKGPRQMSKLLNWALTDLLSTHPELIMMGEDIGRKGGVYGITQNLSQKFGARRVVDTLLDEQSILGLAIGMAQNGFVPIPEIQFLAYLHNAEDQLRGEAATLPFFSNGQFTNPMVVRIAGLGYQKGFGGHFHNDNSLAVLRDIPGLISVVPSTGAEAVMLLREAVRLAREEQRIVAFVEPIALYSTRDLFQDGDCKWLTNYPEQQERAAFLQVGQRGSGTDLAIVTFGNGVFLSEQCRPGLEADGIKTRVIDLRWLSPLPQESLTEALGSIDRILVVDETRRTGGVAEGVMAYLSETTEAKLARVTADDSFIATGPAYGATLPSRKSINDAARALMKR
ncbi:MAG: thiamine pyrophosphate-dependent enzyme [Pseudomonadota bacterium]